MLAAATNFVSIPGTRPPLVAPCRNEAIAIEQSAAADGMGRSSTEIGANPDFFAHSAFNVLRMSRCGSGCQGGNCYKGQQADPAHEILLSLEFAASTDIRARASPASPAVGKQVWPATFFGSASIMWAGHLCCKYLLIPPGRRGQPKRRHRRARRTAGKRAGLGPQECIPITCEKRSSPGPAQLVDALIMTTPSCHADCRLVLPEQGLRAAYGSQGERQDSRIDTTAITPPGESR